MLGFSPFQGVILSLVVIGTLFNQILTFNGLFAYLKDQGFNKVTAVLGGLAALAAGIYCLGAGFNPAFLILGMWVGGNIKGLSRWLYTRGIDMVRFPLQLVVHALGQRIFQSLEFGLSGESAAEFKKVDMRDKLREKPSNFVNIRNAWLIWGVGLFALNLAAITFDSMLSNVILLYPFLIFSVGLTSGIFIMSVSRGKNNRLSPLARLSGWIV